MGTSLKVVINTLFWSFLLLVSPAVAVLLIRLNHEKVTFGATFFAEALGHLTWLLGIPLLVAWIAAKFRGISRIAFLVAWVVLALATVSGRLLSH